MQKINIRNGLFGAIMSNDLKKSYYLWEYDILVKNILRGALVAELKASNVKKFFKQGEETVYVLKGVSAQFEQGTTYALTGPSGSGKSTFMHLLAGLDTPDEGTISFNGFEISTMSDEQRRNFLNKTVGLVFQQPYLIRELTVIENVMLKGLIEGLEQPLCHAEALALLGKVGLESKAENYPMALSGGEQQRVAIARALFNRPAFLLADEPTGNLDVATGTMIIDLLLACQAEWNMGIIVSSHDAYVAAKMKHVLHLKDGILLLSEGL